MVSEPSPRPTDSELTVLRVLWDRGPSTVRQIHEALAHRGVGYTTTLKTMQIMVDKRLLRHNESKRSHLYFAAVEEEPTQRGLIRDLLDLAFGGSAAKLVMRAIAAREITPDEVAEIRKVLKRKGRDNA